jgi:ATP-binding cassette subfamily A (ABC1) protein 3
MNKAMVSATVSDPAARTIAIEAMDAVELHRMPYPGWLSDGFLFAIQFGLPFLLMLSLVYTVLCTVRNVVHEKERKLKESMKMMGLRSWVHWSAWFAQSFIMMTISIVIICFEIKYGEILVHSDITLIGVFFLLYATASIMFCFMISSFFQKASTAASGGAFMWFVSYVPAFVINAEYATLSLTAKHNYCLISNTCMALGANIISQQEGNGVGVTWDRVNLPISVDDPFTFSSVLWSFARDAVLYFFIAWYLEGIWPGDFGVPQLWYFPLSPQYWGCGAPAVPGSSSTDGNGTGASLANIDGKFEAVPNGMVAGLELRNLRKEFGSGEKMKVAVKDTSLDMFEGQVTALLGHNGAGKTTTMSMITGLYPPTSGTAVVMGHNVATATSEAQQSLGICPQHDVLFDTLTVEEHLYFFCKLKGVPEAQCQGQIDDMIDSLQLEEKRHKQSSTLSGGQKRRLSAGIAIVGGSRVVILDEPTSGIDPSARRAVWDVINKYKEGRTILLSTHFMDEADLLGDRIAIMAEGVVKCCGSSMFLKRNYGEGYSLIMAKKEHCDVGTVTAFVKSHIPGANLQSSIGTEMTYLLPQTASASFEKMFAELEAKVEPLGIASFGCSVTTLEEVFLKVGRHDQVDNEDDDVLLGGTDGPVNGAKFGHTKESSADDDDVALLIADGEMGPTRMKPGGWKQFRAMSIKRMKNSMRNRWTLAFQLVPPLLFTLLSLLTTNTRTPVVAPPPRDLNAFSKSYGSDHTIWVAGPQGGLSPNVSDAVNATLGANAGTVKFVPPTDDVNINDFLAMTAGSSGRSQDIYNFNRKTPVLLELPSAGPYVGWFNGEPYHAVTEALGAIDSVISAQYTGATIAAENFPLPKSLNEQIQDQQNSFEGFNLAFSVLFGMAPMAASFLIFLVSEKESKAKHVQFVSGVTPFAYWFSAYWWDFFCYLAPMFGCFTLFAAFNIEAYIGVNFHYVLGLFLLYGLSIIPLIYLSSFLFTNASSAFVRMTLFNIITGLTAMMAVTILSVIPSTKKTADALRHIFLFLPNYCFGQGLSDMFTNHESASLLKKVLESFEDTVFAPAVKIIEAECTADGYPKCCATLKADFDKVSATVSAIACPVSPYAMEVPGAGRYIVGMIIQIPVFLLLLILIERRILPSLWEKIRGLDRKRQGPRAPLNPTVQAEHDALDNLDGDSSEMKKENMIVMQDMYRSFGQKVAVDGVSVAIPTNACFGLLGVNGAGKTTTFRMLTGEIPLTTGAAYLAGKDVRTEMGEIRQKIGYCPQFDALVDFMTGRELLEMFANLRGIPDEQVDGVVQNLITRLTLDAHCDKITKGYSGGNKRKLCTAIALVGDPPIVFLDEPTTGMDPGARRFLWNVLLDVVKQGRTIVLTSHSMEECEALCTRLTIMVNGQFQALGSPQLLKSTYGGGISLTTKLPIGASVQATNMLVDKVTKIFPNAIVKERHPPMVRFVIQDIPLSAIFGEMERAKEEFGLEDYAVSQATLEQVFLEFADKQEPEESMP